MHTQDVGQHIWMGIQQCTYQEQAPARHACLKTGCVKVAELALVSQEHLQMKAPQCLHFQRGWPACCWYSRLRHLNEPECASPTCTRGRSISPIYSQSISYTRTVSSTAITCNRSHQHILGSGMSVLRQEEVHTFLNSRAANSSFTSAGG